VDSLFVWLGAVEQPYHAIEDATLVADPAIMRNNAFVDFDEPNGAVHLDETDTPSTTCGGWTSCPSCPPAGAVIPTAPTSRARPRAPLRSRL